MSANLCCMWRTQHWRCEHLVGAFNGLRLISTNYEKNCTVNDLLYYIHASSLLLLGLDSGVLLGLDKTEGQTFQPTHQKKPKDLKTQENHLPPANVGGLWCRDVSVGTASSAKFTTHQKPRNKRGAAELIFYCYKRQPS